MPYGEVKTSGAGCDGVKYATDELTETKLAVWKRKKQYR
jgi:hypothetical protein